MDGDDVFAGEYVTTMLAVIGLWIAFIIVGITIGGYLAASKLGL